MLLFGITNSVKDAAANDSRISESTVAAISERNIDLVSDENFRASIEDIDMSDEERDALVEINAQSRFNSTRFAYYVALPSSCLAWPPPLLSRSSPKRRSRS